MGSFGGFEWLIIILIIIFFFGAKKIPDLARGLGQGWIEFKKASRNDEPRDEIPDRDPDKGESQSYKEDQSYSEEDRS